MLLLLLLRPSAVKFVTFRLRAVAATDPSNAVGRPWEHCLRARDQ